MTSHPLAIMSRKESFINRWKMAGELVSPKNIRNHGFKQPLMGDEGSLPLVTILDLYVVVPPSNIKFGENFGIA